ncbi:S26 family signal peptidase [Actinoallomurus acanthiterrae]
MPFENTVTRRPYGMPVVAGVTTVLCGTAAVIVLRSLQARLALVRVVGSSMAPTFADGDRLLVRRTVRPRRGDVVVFRNPAKKREPDPPWLVKRVSAVPGDQVPEEVLAAVGAAPGAVVPLDRLVVRGDAERSLDSRQLGYISAATVLGTVLRPL